MGMVLPMNYVEIEQEEMMYLDGGGPVGLVINLSQKTRNMAGWVAGVFVGAYVGYHLKPLAAMGAGVGAGFAALIVGAVVASVKFVVDKGLKTVDLTYRAAGKFTWVKHVSI